MSAISESDEDSDLDQQVTKEAKPVKKAYIHKTRELTVKKQKKESDIAVDEYDSDDEAYNKMLTNAPEDEEDEFERQLRLETEEAARVKEQQEQKKTKTDPDGTEYEWDETVKGWFPKVDE